MTRCVTKLREATVLVAKKTGIMDHQRGSVRQSLCYVILYTCFALHAPETLLFLSTRRTVAAAATSYSLADSFFFISNSRDRDTAARVGDEIFRETARRGVETRAKLFSIERNVRCFRIVNRRTTEIENDRERPP